MLWDQDFYFCDQATLEVLNFAIPVMCSIFKGLVIEKQLNFTVQI